MKIENRISEMHKDYEQLKKRTQMNEAKELTAIFVATRKHSWRVNHDAIFYFQYLSINK